MAQPKPDPALEALTRKAAEEAKAHNPRLGAPRRPYTDAEYAAALGRDQETERVAREVADALGAISISRLIDEDRGE